MENTKKFRKERYKVDDVINNDYIQMPRFLFDDEFDNLSNGAKVLYSLLKDRHKLSMKNEWIDENGEVYLKCKREEMAKLLKCSEPSARKCFKELVKYELVEDERIGNNKANMIYLTKVTIKTYLKNERKGLENTRTKKFFRSGPKNSFTPDRKNFSPNKNNINKNNINKNTDCPENKIEQIIEQIETRNNTSENNNKASTNVKSVSTKKGYSIQPETNNKIEYKIEYLKELYSYDQICLHHDKNVVNEVLYEILRSINGKKSIKICGNKKQNNEVFENVEVFTSRVLKFDINNIINIVKIVTAEMQKNKITHVDLFIRTLCINQSKSYIKDMTKDKKQKELNTQQNYNKVPQETNYEQREYTEEYLNSFYEDFWTKYEK